MGAQLVLEYNEQYGDGDWVQNALDKDEEVTLSKVFTFENQDRLLEVEKVEDQIEESESYEFALGTLTEDGYFEIKPRILGTSSKVFLPVEGLKIERKVFIAERGISIFKRIDNLVNSEEDIVIGGSRPDRIPVDEFRALLNRFPNTTEVKHYARARISRHLSDYFEDMTDADEEFRKYLNSKGSDRTEITDMPKLAEFDIAKFEFIRDSIREFLKDANTYSEEQWQKIIVQFILLIFPKYIAVIEKLRVSDYYSSATKVINREIDLCLVDANGNIDIIEIKIPHNENLLYKRKYRDNYTPKKELAGCIMQAEKYIFHLNKWGIKGEQEINKRHQTKMPNGIKIKIRNPKAMLIIGRSRNNSLGRMEPFNQQQEFDFEIIRRKYSNIMDILTYDDLLERLDNIIISLKSRTSGGTPTD